MIEALYGRYRVSPGGGWTKLRCACLVEADKVGEKERDVVDGAPLCNDYRASTTRPSHAIPRVPKDRIYWPMNKIL
jgi:hypothetical protein